VPRSSTPDSQLDPYSRLFTSPELDWDEIGSPVARRAIRAAYRALPADTHRGPAFDDPDKCPWEIHEYQQWLHQQLRDRGLAKALAGGQAFLPDCSDELSQPWRWLARLFAPRTIEQLTRHVAVNLEWYVDQSRPLRDPWKLASDLVFPTALLTALVAVPLLLTTGIGAGGWVIALGASLLVAALVYGLMLIFGRNTHKHRTNCAELYEYLLEAYSELDEQSAQAESLGQQLRGKV